MILEVRPADLVARYDSVDPGLPEQSLWRAYLHPDGDKIEARVDDPHLRLFLITERARYYDGHAWALLDQYGRLHAIRVSVADGDGFVRRFAAQTTKLWED